MTEVLRNRLRELLDQRSSALGTFITLADPVAVDLAGLAGFEFIVIECEHSALSLETVQSHLRAARARGLGTLVRVPAGDHGFIQRCLDIGAEGVLVPHISDANAAARASGAVRFPPDGHRGMYPGSAAAEFGAHGLPGVKELTQALNRSTVLAVMIEEDSAVDQIEKIVRTPGIDLVVVGPSDLSASLGVMGDPQDPLLAAAVARIFGASREAGVRFGMPADHAGYRLSAAELRGQGAWFLTGGSDAALLLNAFKASVKGHS
ncbi:MAG TPA: aldolase/citrate lyase family protein [Candidatus Dormibacteraeota bacterium]|nr:aldolase/citrate lyase family protein [Candidatus Dormibacteraeota bacterium]